MLFLISDEIERLYIQKYDGSLIINGFVVKVIRNQVTSLCTECPLSLNSIFFSQVNDSGEESEDYRGFDALAEEH